MRTDVEIKCLSTIRQTRLIFLPEFLKMLIVMLSKLETFKASKFEIFIVNLFFRIAEDFSFDDDAANSYGATVRSFDPT